jgi:hypothetical protein
MIGVHELVMDSVLLMFVIPAAMVFFDGFSRHGTTLAESAAYSTLSVIMVLSWLAQIIVLAGWVNAYLPAILSLSVLSLARLYACRRRYLPYLRSVYRFSGQHRLVAVGLLMVWGYVLVRSTLGMTGSDEAADIFWQWAQEHPESVLVQWPHPIPVLNHLIFSAPWQPAIATPLARLAASVTIGCGTYALARRYAWPSMAATVALLVAGMPRLVSQTVAGGTELTAAASALVAILALYRLIEKPAGFDAVLLLAAISFTAENGRFCFLIVIVLLSLSGFLLVRRHGASWFWQKGRMPYRQLIIALLAVAVFSQAVAISANLFRGLPWIGASPHLTAIFNADPLLGTVGNLARYLILSIDFPHWVDGLSQTLFGLKASAGLELLYHRAVTDHIGAEGAAAAFSVVPGDGAAPTWFGLVGFLLVLPSVAMSLWRGPRRLKATALAMVAYWVLVSLIAAWQPQNVRLLTVFFVCSGFFMAFFLPPWRIGYKARLFLQAIGIIQIVYVLLV